MSQNLNSKRKFKIEQHTKVFVAYAKFAYNEFHLIVPRNLFDFKIHETLLTFTLMGIAVQKIFICISSLLIDLLLHLYVSCAHMNINDIYIYIYIYIFIYI